MTRLPARAARSRRGGVWSSAMALLAVTLVVASAASCVSSAPAMAPALASAARSAPDAATATRPLIWTVTGPNGSLTLAGSIHALRDTDHPLPPAFDKAYAAAARLVLEVELDGAAAGRELGAALEAGRLPRGTTLREVLGAANWAEAERLAAAANVDLDSVLRQEPWLATLTLVNQAWRAQGLDGARGLDQHFLERARADGKTVLGLERVADQLALFDGLPPAEQQRQLLDTLRELPTAATELDGMIAAWRGGDLASWDETLAELDNSPALRRGLLDERHARWLPQLERMLTEPTPTLVVVGALHLVGTGSLLAGLERRGYRVERWPPAPTD